MKGRIARVNECGHPKSDHKGHGMCNNCYMRYKRKNITPEEKEKFAVRNREYSKREYERSKKAKTIYHRNMRIQTWKLLFEHYGTVCACCGEANPIFLTLDHINNDGAEHRKSMGGRSGYNLHRQVVANNFPSGFQILCYNCNCGRARNNGICPHNKEKLNGVS